MLATAFSSETIVFLLRLWRGSFAYRASAPPAQHTTDFFELACERYVSFTVYQAAFPSQLEKKLQQIGFGDCSPEYGYLLLG